MSAVDEKLLQRALLHITALDERKRRGEWDGVAQLALQDAEHLVLSASGSQLLAAWRRWRDSSVRSFDPTRRSVRTDGEQSSRPVAMRPGSR